MSAETEAWLVVLAAVVSGLLLALLLAALIEWRDGR